MDQDPAKIFGVDLESQERIVWSGRPRQGLVFRALDSIMVPLTWMWGVVVFVGEFLAITRGAPLCFVLMGIPFVLMGLYVTVGRFITDAKERERTYYALTDKRIIIVTGLFARKVSTIDFKSLPELNIIFHTGGRGTILFGSSQDYRLWSTSYAWPGKGRYTPPAFDMIDDVKQVYELIRKAQHENKGGEH
jgi:hypothetical protein